MNICFMLGGLHQNGGIGRVTAMLANALSLDSNYQISILCYYNSQMPNIYDVSSRIKQDYFLNSYTSMTHQILFGGIGKLRKYLKQNDIDVLIACGALYYPISVIACNKIKTKCICWEHSNPEGNSDHRGQYWARLFGIKRSDLNVVLTKRALDIFKSQYKIDNTIQIYNPVDDAVFKSAGEYNSLNKRIISVGRLSYQKNFELAIEIASKVLIENPEWNWDVYGKGEEESHLRALIERKGISDRFHLCGQVEDLYERYKNYSLMVMTSRYEGFPMSLLEGLGNSLPLISFDVPTGPSEIIDNGINGYLIEPFKVETMISRINILINDVSLREKMSIAAREKAIMFSQQEFTNSWKNVLSKI